MNMNLLFLIHPSFSIFYDSLKRKPVNWECFFVLLDTCYAFDN